MFLDKTVTVIRNTTTTNPSDFVYVPFSNVVKRIQTGANDLNLLSATAQALKAGGAEEYRDWKAKELPAVIPAGMFDRFKDNKASHAYAAWSGQHTGFVVPDFDNVENLPALLEKLKALPYVFFLFSSPSAVGCKPFVCLDPLPKDRDEHKIAWECLKTEIENAVGYQLTIDKQCKNLNRLCYLAHDPNCYINEKAEAFKWSKPKTNPSPKPKPHPTEKTTVDQAREVLSYLSADDREDWVNVGHAMKHEGLPFSLWKEWSSKSAAYDPSEDMQARWDGFNPDGGITWASVVYKAQQNGYKAPNGKSKKKGKPRVEKEESPFFSGSKFLPLAMRDYLNNAGIKTLSLRHEPFLRVYRKGVYVQEQGEVLNAMQTALGVSSFKMSHYNETVSLLSESITPAEQCEHKGVLNMKNGMFDLNTFELEKHDPKRFSLTQMPVDVDKEADCPAIWDWLKDVLDNDDAQIKLFFEAVGYTLFGSTALQKMFILLGQTQTGKSTAMHIMKSLIGKDNTSAMELSALEDESNRFSRSQIHGRIANFSADISPKYLTGDGNVKKIISGDPITAEHKFKEPFIFEPNCTLWAMANEMPASRDKSGAWYQRLVIFRFEKQFLAGSGSEPNTNLIDTLTTPEELAGLFKTAICFGKDAITRGSFGITDTNIEALTEYIEANDHVMGFCQALPKNFEYDDSEFYELYKEWCEDEGVEKPLSKNRLAQSCTRYTVKRIRKKEDGQRFFVWKR